MVHDLLSRALPQKWSVWIVLVSLAWAVDAQAQWSSHRFGAGFRLGDPSGVSAKLWLHSQDAVQLDFGWRAAYRNRGTTYYYSGPTVSADWVHQFSHFGPRSHLVWFGLHIGAGASLDTVSGNQCYYDSFGNQYCSNALTARMPLAFNVYLAKVRLEVLLELVPGLRLTPQLQPTITASLAGRYYF